MNTNKLKIQKSFFSFSFEGEDILFKIMNKNVQPGASLHIILSLQPFCASLAISMAVLPTPSQGELTQSSHCARSCGLVTLTHLNI